MDTRRLALPDVTLCAASSVNVAATVEAMHKCLEHVEFGACKLFVDKVIEPLRPGMQLVPIAPLTSSVAYSQFVLRDIVQHIATSHCLIVQWDGHVLNAGRWNPAFLEYDYIGARWPQFSDGHDVGNGGFSLRSRRLMELCSKPEFRPGGAEDIAVCRVNRAWLESMGMRFAPADLANAFASERAGDLRASFGYHGAFNMPEALGSAEFARIYKQLDDRSTIWHDFWPICRTVLASRHGLGLVAQMAADRLTE